MVVSQIAGDLAERAALLLDPPVRERVWQREAKWRMVLTIFHYLSFGVILLGFLKARGLIRFHSEIAWDVPAIAAGTVLNGLGMLAEAWLRATAYKNEPGSEPARGKVKQIFMLVLASELLWCGVIAYVFVLPMFKPNTSKQGTTANESTDELGGEHSKPAPKDPAKPSAPWINQREALDILKVDREYFALLVKTGEIEVKLENGTTLYSSNSVITLKRDGMPLKEDLQERVDQEKAKEHEKPAPPPDESIPKNPERKPLQE
jgi:hypothetical protein